MTNNKWYTEAIDRAVSEREFARLTDMIRSPDLSSEDRDYLAKTVLGLLMGNIRTPSHRPKKSKTELEAKDIAFEAVRLNRYRPEWSKLSAVVKKVAEDRGCSEPKVWKCLRKFRWAIVAKLEEQEYDSMVDDAMEAEWAEAVKHLREEHGDREFSDEEVDAEIEEMHRSWEDAHPDG